MDLIDAVEILELKIKKLEHLLYLRDAKMKVLQTNK
jgi:hypothetical protein